MWRCRGRPGRDRKPPAEADCPARQRKMPQSGRRRGVSTWRAPRRRLLGTKPIQLRGTRSASPSIFRLAIHFTHHLNGLVEIRLAIMAHDIEHLPQDRIRQGIENLIAFLPVYHDLAAAQDGEVLGEVGLLNPEPGLHGSGGKLSVAEDLDDGNARGMRQGLKYARLVRPHLIGHNIRVFAFSNFRKYGIQCGDSPGRRLRRWMVQAASLYSGWEEKWLRLVIWLLPVPGSILLRFGTTGSRSASGLARSQTGSSGAEPRSAGWQPDGGRFHCSARARGPTRQVL